MSSKRGRKRNDNLPPNRARDVQRAFRARRAAHLQALEHRVSELEEENDCLRQALNLPPASRPALGKGPTGKDKPKAFDSPILGALSKQSCDSESDSPPSTRRSSHSPGGTEVGLDDGVWEQTIVMPDNKSDCPSSSPPSSYSMTAPPSSKPLQFNPYPPSSSRSSSMATPMYYQLAERSMSDHYPSPNFSVRPSRDDHRLGQYSYSPSQYGNSIQNTSSPASLHMRDYPRRSLSDVPSYTIDSGFPHLPPVHHGTRLPSPLPLPDSRDQLPTRSIFNAVSDGRT